MGEAMTPHQKRLEEIRKRCEAASPMPWKEQWPTQHPGVVYAADELLVASFDRCPDDAKAAIAAMEAVSWLLRAVERLEVLVPHGDFCVMVTCEKCGMPVAPSGRCRNGHNVQGCTCDRDKRIAACFEGEVG